MSKYVGVMAETRTICLCSIPNRRSLASMVYLFASKLEGESGPRFLPVREGWGGSGVRLTNGAEGEGFGKGGGSCRLRGDFDLVLT